MAKNSKIQWTTHTFNPWRGCTKVSAGCANCYAETQSKRNPGTLGVWGPNGSRVVASESMWREPLEWNKDAKNTGDRHRVFCASLADVFEDWQGPMVDHVGQRLWWPNDSWNEKRKWVPDIDCGGDEKPVTMPDVRNRLFALIDATPHLDWLLLTKRPQHVLEAGSTLAERWLNVGPPANVWIGTSVEDQAAADERIPHLLKIPAKVRFLSCEPLLGPVNLRPYLGDAHEQYQTLGRPVGIDWVIVGGESGRNARPCHIEWVLGIVRQCKEAGVSVFVKQLGSHPIETCYVTTASSIRGQTVGMAILDPKGGDMDEWPTDLQVREVPA